MNLYSVKTANNGILNDVFVNSVKVNLHPVNLNAHLAMEIGKCYRVSSATRRELSIQTKSIQHFDDIMYSLLISKSYQNTNN